MNSVICEKCGTELQIGQYPFCNGDASKHQTTGAYIASDDIPGGIEIRHGICNPDGTPKRYYSKTEIKRALNEKGYQIAGDTPGRPYNVGWSGRRADGKERGER